MPPAHPRAVAGTAARSCAPPRRRPRAPGRRGGLPFGSRARARRAPAPPAAAARRLRAATRSSPSGCCVFRQRRELLGLMLGGELVEDLVEVPVHDGGDLVQREVDAVVRDAALREVVGPDPVGAVAAADEGLARRRLLRPLLAQLLVLDPRTEQRQRARLVLVL